MGIPNLTDGRLKVRHLVLVDMLGTQGSVVGAANALHITQPVVSRSLQDLEQILGVKLYERGPRGLTPTEFGEAFTTHARAVLAQLDQAARHVAEIADADRGEVTIGTHLTGSNLLIPRAIGALKSDHPLLTVIVREGPSDLLTAELQSGRVDVMVGRIATPPADGLVRRPLYKESVRVVVGAHHPLARRLDVSIEDAMHYPWVLPGSDTMLRHELVSYFMELGLEVPANRVETTSFLTVRQLLLDTEHVAVMPELIAREDARIARLPFELERVSHSVGVTLAAGRELSPAVAATVRALRATAQHLFDETPPE